MLRRQSDHRGLYDGFVWRVPERYNIGVDVCDRHADGSGRRAAAASHCDRATWHVVRNSKKAKADWHCANADSAAKLECFHQTL